MSKKSSYGRDKIPAKKDMLISGKSKSKEYNIRDVSGDSSLGLTLPLNSFTVVSDINLPNEEFIVKYGNRIFTIIKALPISNDRMNELSDALGRYGIDFPAFCKFHSDNSGDSVPLQDDRFSFNPDLNIWAAVLFPISLDRTRHRISSPFCQPFDTAFPDP